MTSSVRPLPIYNDRDHEQPTLCMKKSDLKLQVAAAIQACLDKKAEELSILEMEKGSGAFTDYFVLCSGTNPRQVQAIADEVELRLKRPGCGPRTSKGINRRNGYWSITSTSLCTFSLRRHGSFMIWNACGRRRSGWNLRN